MGTWERGDGEANGEALIIYCSDVLGTAVADSRSGYNSMEYDQRIKNLEFIAHARSDVPYLLEENARLRKMVDQK